jgi:Family of unknown function (DUF6152)
MKPITKYAVLAAILFSGLSAATADAAPHHGFAVFDTASQKNITGTVREFQWTNPHTWVWLDVPNGKGGVDTYGFEGMSPNYLERRGWSRKTLKPGDTITVTYFPLKNGDKGGSFLIGKRPNGEELRMFITSPTEDR